MITYQEALAKFLGAARVQVATEAVPTLYAEGRTLARDVVSAINVPDFDNSQMDGYCIKSSDIAMATADSPVVLPVVDRIPAGTSGRPLAAGTCARIFTGAPVPEGADTVVPQEDVALAADGAVRFSRPAPCGAWVRRRAGDVAEGSVVARKGDLLSPALLGLIASVGAGYVEVYKPLKVGVFFTGDELVAPGEPLKKGGIYNSNRYTVRALLKKIGCEVLDLGVIGDTLEETKAALSDLARRVDVILTTGGMSVGEEDHLKPAVESLGRLDMWRVAVKPGKPVALGEVAGTPFIGLPGNPVSGFVTFFLLARPYLLKSQGRVDAGMRPIRIRADFAWSKAGNREEFVRVRRNEQGGLDLYPTQNSQILTSCAWCDGLVGIPAGATVAEGDSVCYYPIGELLA